jgi:hypothetical protein
MIKDVSFARGQGTGQADEEGPISSGRPVQRSHGPNEEQSQAEGKDKHAERS